jgi:hypothetical protein
MIAASGNPRVAGSLASLLALAAVLLLASGVLYYVLHARAPAGEQLPAEALYSLAVDARDAAAGDGDALARFQSSQKQLEDAAARHAGAPFAGDARFTRLMGNAAAVLQARSQLTDAARAAHDITGLVPHLTAEAEAFGASLPPATASAAAAPLERFAARAERLQIDVSALTQGAADAGQTAQRIAEASDYLGQVIAGFAGGSTTLALPKVTAPVAEGHLKTLDTTYAELAAAVKRAGRAERRARHCRRRARARCRCSRERCERRTACGHSQLAAVAAARRRPRVAHRRADRGAAHGAHARAPAPLPGRAAQGKRPQPAGDPAAAR